MKDTPYFKHDINGRHDPKVLKIRKKYGSKGYGIYFMLIEMLRSSKKYVLKMDLDTISYDIQEDIDIIEDIINNYKLFKINNGYFYSISLRSRMKSLDNLRKGWQKGGKKRWEKKEDNESIYTEFKG